MAGKSAGSGPARYAVVLIVVPAIPVVPGVIAVAVPLLLESTGGVWW